MMLQPKSYVPSLRWRQGEYQGLMTLSETSKALIRPLITIPPIEFDFESGVLKKSPHEHVLPFPKRLDSKWGKRPFWLDLHPTLRDKNMNEGQSCYSYIFENIRKNGAHAIPIISFDMDVSLKQFLGSVCKIDQHGIGIRVMMEDIMKSDFEVTKSEIINSLELNTSEVDLIIDLEAPNYDPIDGFATALLGALTAMTDLMQYRNVILIGTAFPSSMASVNKGTSAIPRKHWLFYKSLISKLPGGFRIPIFGDYTTVHPGFVAMDMRKIKPAGKIIYTTGENWQITKGGSFRDNRLQMHDHSTSIVNSGYYYGNNYCYGDAYILQCSTKADGPSNLSQWKKVGINHHMTVVLEELSTFSAHAFSL